MNVVINVIGQELRLITPIKSIISGTQEFIKFKFALDEIWYDISPFVQFVQNGTAYNVYLDEDGCAFLPSEIEAGTFTVMLYGEADEIIGTTNYLTIKVDEHHLIEDAESTQISESLYAQLVAKVNMALSASKQRYGSPLVATTADDMDDTKQVYVYTGDETGYTFGYWYYYDNGEWHEGGAYNSIAIPDELEGQIDDLETQLTTMVDAASATAQFALSEVTNIETELAEMENSIDQFDTKLETLELNAESYVDNGYVENGVAYFEHNGNVLFEITGIGGGGGGGGGGEGNNAILTVTNTTGWLSNTIAHGSPCQVSLTWSSTENDIPTGNGVAKVIVNGVLKSTISIAQGIVYIDLGNYVSVGSNICKVQISDVYGNARTINYSITAITLVLTSTFDTSDIYSGAITFPYTPVGAVEKTVHFIVDGTQIGTQVTSVSNRQLSYVIPSQSYGAHSLLVYFTAIINEASVESNRLYYEFMATDGSSNQPIITSSFSETEINQYESVVVPYRVYSPLSLTTDIEIYLNESLVSSQTVDRTEQSYTFRMNTVDECVLEIKAGRTTKTFELTVNPSEADIEPETRDMVLHLDAVGRSNNEETRDEWEYENISCTLSGFNWVTNGWLTDKDGIVVLRLNDDARATIPYKIFENDFKSTGKTIEIEFATREVSDYTDTILSCISDNIGLEITPQTVTFTGAQTQISTLYKENEHIRLSIVVEKQTTDTRLILIYINGVMSRAIQYAAGERFSQLTPVNITIGSNDCGIDIYNIRVYDNDLNREQILNNWIADTQIGTLMLERYTHNNVYENGEITIAMLPNDLPYMIINAAELPQYKGDKKTVSGTYVDPVNPSKSFTFEECQINVQGTSSSVYFRKNYDLQFKRGFIMNNGNTESTYALRTGSIPFNRFVLKADVASSESANNTELVMFYNDTCPYKTPEMLQDSRVRWGIEGIPIVLYWYDTENDTTNFMGKYNYNLPKRAPEPYGYGASNTMESWEFQWNNTANVKFQDDDFDSQKWDETSQQYYPAWYDDFEARFPSDEWRDYTKLKYLISWVKSTWRNTATGNTLSSPVTYRMNTTITLNAYPSDGSYTVTEVREGGVIVGYDIQFTKDTPAYRLTKFRAELANYVEIESATFYYLFTEMFLMIDSWAKNMFIGFNGSPVNINGSPIDRKATFQPYDMDTAIGTNNSGVLMFGYYLESIDTVSGLVSGGNSNTSAPVFNAQDSVFWSNFRDSFRPEIVQMYSVLRSTGGWSYLELNQRFTNHQAKWCEAIFNEDSYIKYIYPVDHAVTVDPATGDYVTTTDYLTMLQGSKAEQRKWWLYNRFRYMDSKFGVGDAANNVLSIRLFNDGTMTITPAIDMYASVRFGLGSTPLVQRTYANTPTQFTFDGGTGVQEFETAIYSGDMITDVGDLSGFYPNEIKFAYASRLKNLKVGDSSVGYSNTNLNSLNISNSPLLETIDCRNCPNLAITVDLENSPRLKEAYFGGTSITGVELADGCAIETLQLPSTITTLVMMNLNKLENLTIASLSNVSRLMLTNMDDDIIDTIDTLNAILPNAQINIQGITYEMQNAQEIEDFLDLLDTFTGVSREKNASGNWIYHDYETAQVSGTIHTASLTGSQIASYNARYPYLRIVADHVSSVLTFKTWDGSSVVGTVNCLDGVMQSSAPTEPSRTSTAQYDFTGVGWSLEQDDDTNDPSVLINVIADRTVYAAYSRTLRSYIITWKNVDNTVIETDYNVPYGTMPSYDTATPTYDGQTSTGWNPIVSPVVGNQIYIATYLPKYQVRFKLAAEDNNGTESTLETQNIIEGQTPVYTGQTPTTSRGIAQLMPFSGWTPTVGAVYAATDYYAVFTDLRPMTVQYITGDLVNYTSNTNNTISRYAFRQFPKLETIQAPITTVESDGIYNNDKLKTVDFTSQNIVSISNNGLYNNKNIESIVIRSSTLSPLNSTTVLYGINKINRGYGGIFVPDNLVSNYKSATNWSNLADHIYPISEYPKIDYCTITDSWADIFEAEQDGTYLTKYSLGDTKRLTIGDNDIYMQIVAFDTDILADGNGTAKITWMSKDNCYKSAFGDNVNWSTSTVRSELRNTIYPSIDSTVKNAIKEVIKTYYAYSSDSTESIVDTLFIPSSREMFGVNGSEDSGIDYTNFFTSSSLRMKCALTDINFSYSDYWLRSSHTSSNYYKTVSNTGTLSNAKQTTISFIPICFCT